jgi:naphthalene 1,2-dioxygenase subunit beta
MNNKSTFDERLAKVRDTDFDRLTGKLVFGNDYQEVESFLYREARLLDTRMFHTWINGMVHEEIKYIVASTQLRANNERRYDLPDKVYLFNDDYQQLKIRVEHDLDPQNWRSSPLEQYCRVVSNIEVARTSVDSEFQVRSNCLIYRARRGYQVDQFFYTRYDLLIRDAVGGFKLKSREVDYPERSVSGHNMLIFL